MHNNTPFFTVLITSFNAEKNIERALNSVLQQSFTDYEIIVSDDGSHDRTLDIVKSMAIECLTIVTNTNTAGTGPGPTRNRGLMLAKGLWTAFFDCDDIWYNNKLAVQKSCIDAHDDAVLVASNELHTFPAEGRSELYFDSAPPVEGKDAWKSLLSYAFIHTTVAVGKTETVKSIGMFREHLIISQDQDMWIRLALTGPVYICSEVLAEKFEEERGHLNKFRNLERNLLPLRMIEEHVRNEQPRLTRRETRHILGYRHAAFGRNLYINGALLSGLKLTLKAIFYGYRPFSHVFFLLHASPLGRYLKKQLRGS